MSTIASPVRHSGPLEHFEHGINRVVMSQGGGLVATSDVDMNVVVRDQDKVLYQGNFSSANEKIRPTERIRGLVFSPSGDLMYVAAGEQVTAIQTNGWNVAWTYVAPRSFGFLIISPIALDVSGSGDVVAAFDNGTIVVWDGHGTRKYVLKDNDTPRWLKFAGDVDKVVGSDSFTLCVWDITKRRRRQKIGLTGRVFGMDVNKTGTVAATRTLQDIVLWDLPQRDILSIIPVSPSIPLLAMHPTRDWLAFGERNRVKIVDFSGVVVTHFELAIASALSIAFDPNGNEILVGCTENKLIRRPI